MNLRKLIAILVFLGMGVSILISRTAFNIWLGVCAVIMFIQTGNDNGWFIEKKIAGVFSQKKGKEKKDG